MKFILEINLDNAAFDYAPQQETARILLALRDGLMTMESDTREQLLDTYGCVLKDANGNTCGYANVELS